MEVFSMIINKIDNFFLIKLLDLTVDTKNQEMLEEIVRQIIEKIMVNNKLNNYLSLDFYIDDNYGTIVKLSHYKSPFFLNDEKTVKIIVHTNTAFLYKIDYLAIKDNHQDKQNIYYYHDNFYLEIKNSIDRKDYLNILEASEIIYEDTYDILDKGIKL